MASSAELTGLLNDSTLQLKVRMALFVKSVALLSSATPDPVTAEWSSQVSFAKAALSNPDETVEYLMRYVVADAEDATLAQIQAVIANSDESTIRSKVAGAVDKIIAGGAV